MHLEDHLKRQIAFSRGAFGPGVRTAGVVEHCRRELSEIEASDGDAEEWVDLVILSLDGLTRALAQPVPGLPRRRYTTDNIARMAAELIVDKQNENESRDWPNWRAADPDSAIEHIRYGTGAPPDQLDKILTFDVQIAGDQAPPTVLVYGPPGCGKTHHAPALAQGFGCLGIGGDLEDPLPIEPGFLYLFNRYPLAETRTSFDVVIDAETAFRVLGITARPDKGPMAGQTFPPAPAVAPEPPEAEDTPSAGGGPTVLIVGPGTHQHSLPLVALSRNLGCAGVVSLYGSDGQIEITPCCLHTAIKAPPVAVERHFDLILDTETLRQILGIRDMPEQAA